jgi:hypothetical protein
MVCEGSLGGPTCWASELERWLSGPTDVWGLVTRTWKLLRCRPSKLLHMRYGQKADNSKAADGRNGEAKQPNRSENANSSLTSEQYFCQAGPLPDIPRLGQPWRHPPPPGPSSLPLASIALVGL